MLWWSQCYDVLAYELAGLARGGQLVSNCKEVFGKAVRLLVELASLQVIIMFCILSLCSSSYIITDSFCDAWWSDQNHKSESQCYRTWYVCCVNKLGIVLFLYLIFFFQLLFPRFRGHWATFLQNLMREKEKNFIGKLNIWELQVVSNWLTLVVGSRKSKKRRKNRKL